MSRLVGKPTMWFPTRSDTNRPVQLQKRARILKFRIKVEEELYYPSNCEADQCLCFRLGRLLVFPCGGSYVEEELYYLCSENKVTAQLICAFVFAWAKIQFSQGTAQTT